MLEAPPGAGKTTVVPLALLDQPWLKNQKLLLLEPRRLAARAAAERMAFQLGEEVGETVGYRIRLDTKVGPNTRIEVVTEGILTRMLQADPSLDGVGLVIFDEFHERSLDADLGLALCLQTRLLFRDDHPLKLLVMSATLDGAAVAQLMGNAPMLRSEGRQHPVELRYCNNRLPLNQRIADPICDVIQQALSDQSGSLLVFLPGQAEIRQVQQQLSQQLTSDSNIEIQPLYGDLNLQQQRQAISPAAPGQRKIVLATNIAETSLTIEGVRVVIDSGLSRQAEFDANTGMTRLHTRRISQAASKQRMGRAGRTEPGVCYRLWSETQQQELAAFSTPEILQADLSALALQLFRWGIDDPAELDWLNAPPSGSFAQSTELLQQLGALQQRNDSWQITTYGEQLSELPSHPRLAHLMLTGVRFGLTTLACQLATLLSERDPFSNRQADIHSRIAWLNGNTSCPPELKGTRQRNLQQYRRFNDLCQGIQIADTKPVADPEHPRWLGFLIASAYPDRIAQRRNNSYKFSNGRAAQLSDGDALQQHSWLAVAQSGGQANRTEDRIFLASSLDPELFEHLLAMLVSSRQQVSWDYKNQRLVAEHQHRIGQLILQQSPLDNPPQDQCHQAIIAMLRKKGLQQLSWSKPLQQWRARVNFLHLTQQAQPDNPWPDLSDQALLDTLERWLAPYLDNVRTLGQLAALDLHNILQALLPWPLPQQLEQLAPERYQVPSGNHIRIDYQQSPPVLAVKLQEMFGCAETPTVGLGTALMLHLLSPAQRPLQVTQDLVSFWHNGYRQVQKDMKGRYPKHPWPDNPLDATATARVKHPKRH